MAPARSRPCSCRSHPVVLRLALPPGTAPEIVASLVQAAIRAYLSERREADDTPRKLTPAEYRDTVRAIAAPYMEAAKCSA